VAGLRGTPQRFRKTKVGIYFRQQRDEAGDLAGHVLLATEHMGVVLLERARAHQSVEGAGRFIAVADAELGVAKW
jgi:hypothetical protein